VRRLRAVITATVADAPSGDDRKAACEPLSESAQATRRWIYCHSLIPEEAATIKIVFDVTRLVREGKLTPEQAEESKALFLRDIEVLAIKILMSFGTIAIVAEILALNSTLLSRPVRQSAW
jgi:uracil-DNA glycosylase